MQYIDLTLQVSKTNKIYQWAQIQPNKERVMGHVGTHIDLYNKKTLPIEYMQRRGIVFDVSHIKNREITSDDIDMDDIKKGDFVMFYTGLIKKHPYGSGKYFNEGVSFSWELIDALIEEQVSFIGLDAPDLRRGEEHMLADKRCEQNKIFVIENMMNLDRLEEGKVIKVLTMWHEDLEATGIKVRVVATQP